MKDSEGEKDSVGLGGSVIPEPLTPYPYIATAFFTVILVNTPLNPYLATGFKTRKCNLNARTNRKCRIDQKRKDLIQKMQKMQPLI